MSAATAEAAAQAALTGHLVLATLHTNDSPSAVTRLMDLGLPDYLIASVLRGAVAQRLVRTLCAACREPYEAPVGLAERLGLDDDEDVERLHDEVIAGVAGDDLGDDLDDRPGGADGEVER